LLVKKLDAIYNSQIRFTPEEIAVAKNDYLKVDNRYIQKETKHTIEAYEKIGSEAIKGVFYSKTEIDRLLKAFDKKADNNKMFSKRVRDEIQAKFIENTQYKKEDLLNWFSEIFKNNGIKAKVTINTVKKYFGLRELKGKRIGYVQLFLFKPDFELD
jgi:hypothetical protein